MKEILISIVEAAIEDFKRMNDALGEFQSEYHDAYQTIIRDGLTEF